ncbi:MAG: SDR family oxidoreductase, partial [Candidatus Diapherotrites archaeon]|nr:SDR family oxidoreductase [Candidatus Diapherotrites archaeon]
MLAPEFLDEKRKKEIAEKNLLKKWGSPKDIANTVAFLIEGTDFMTGEIVNVDGGSAIQGFAPE